LPLVFEYHLLGAVVDVQLVDDCALVLDLELPVAVVLLCVAEGGPAPAAATPTVRPKAPHEGVRDMLNAPCP